MANPEAQVEVFIVRRLFSLVLAVSGLAGVACHAQQTYVDTDADRTARHQSEAWQMVAPHLPSLTTGNPDALMVAGDVLRARRMPEDALDYYRAAAQHGASEPKMLNRIGVTLMELHDGKQARQCFQRALQLSGKNSEIWNNLGAAEYIGGDYRSSIQDYKRAVKLNKKAAVFHSNLGTAYFEVKDFESAEKQFIAALKLDPAIFEQSNSSGIEARVLTSEDRGRFCFEMARLSAQRGKDAEVMDWLAKAVESGFDLRYELSKDRSLAAYQADPRVAVLIKNAKTLRAGFIAASGPAPALPAEMPKPN